MFNDPIMILMIVIMLVVLYVLMIRPENKRKKTASDMRENLAVGDNVTTVGGIVGKVVRVEDTKITLETSDDKVRIEIVKQAINNVTKQDAD